MGVGDYGEYVPMSSPAKPSLSPGLPTPTSTPERRGGGSHGHAPSHPPPPYSAPHATRPTRLPLARRSFREATSTSTASAGTSTSASDRPSSPGEYINIEFTPGSSSSSSSFPLSAQEEVLSPGSSAAVVCCSPHQDYMSVEVGAGDRDPGKNLSPRPSLVAPWNPPSYIRPLASNAGLLTSQPGGPPRAGGHWKALGDDYTDMTFNLSRGGGEGPRASPTAVLQHLCVMEGHYGGHPAPASSSTSSSSAHAPGSPSRTGAEPKVVRADPQGRRRHSSETFTSPPSSSVTATPTTASATSTLGLPSSTTDAPNGAHPADGVLPCRWSGGSGSFDSVWMSVEGLGAESSAPGHAHSHASSSSYSSGRMCRNTSSGYQNGLNYIALELREEAGAMATAATTAMAVAAVPTDGSVAGSNGSLTPTETTTTTTAMTTPPPMSENGGYTSIDFTKSTDAVAAATKGGGRAHLRSPYAGA
ncbi:hypothetical protein CRUP_023383 [Coryphaenoides rupestris]|nr:hypothetical protein CRUP_023383 [Coryphaenoides rupestris]